MSVQQIYYPGAALTQVAALGGAGVATEETSVSAAYTNLATVGPTVVVTVPSSGAVLVLLAAGITAQVGQNTAFMSVALSGGNTLAAADANALQLTADNQAITTEQPYPQWGKVALLTGLTPGSTTFQAKYRVSGGTTGFWKNRALAVLPVDGVAIQAAQVATDESTASTTYADLATPGPSIIFTVPTSGRVLLLIGFQASIDSGNLIAQFMGFTGAGLAANDQRAAFGRVNGAGRGNSLQGSRFAALYLSGLPVGPTTFTAQYRVQAYTVRFATRVIAAIGLP